MKFGDTIYQKTWSMTVVHKKLNICNCFFKLKIVINLLTLQPPLPPPFCPETRNKCVSPFNGHHNIITSYSIYHNDFEWIESWKMSLTIWNFQKGNNGSSPTGPPDYTFELYGAELKWPKNERAKLGRKFAFEVWPQFIGFYIQFCIWIWEIWWNKTRNFFPVWGVS